MPDGARGGTCRLFILGLSLGDDACVLVFFQPLVEQQTVDTVLCIILQKAVFSRAACWLRICAVHYTAGGSRVGRPPLGLGSFGNHGTGELARYLVDERWGHCARYLSEIRW